MDFDDTPEEASYRAKVRAWRRSPDALLPLMLKAFPAKVVFFVGYVGLVLGTTDVRLVPFVGSFASVFLLTHLTEAVYLRRLLGEVLSAGSDAETAPGDELRETE